MKRGIAMITSLDRLIRSQLLVCALMLVGILFTQLVSAQDAPAPASLAPGMRVRLVAPDMLAGKIVGTLQLMDEESVTVQIEGRSEPLSVRRDKIARLDVSAGHRSRWFYAGIGAAAGALGGAIAGGNHKSTLFHGDYTTNEAATQGGVIGAAAGAVIGALIPPGERWTRAEASSFRVSFAPRLDHGVGLSFAVGF
jgi:hypothetical protein